MIRLAMVVGAYPTPSETFIRNKARALRAAGVDVTVIAHRLSRMAVEPADPPVKVSPVGEGVRGVVGTLRAGATRHRVAGFLRGGRSAARERMVRDMRLLPFTRQRFDIVHFEFSALAGDYTALLSDIDAKLVMSCRGAAEQIRPLWDERRAATLRTALEMVDAVHCVSEDMACTVRSFGADPAKIFVNRPAIDVDAFRRHNPYEERTADLRVVSVGRLHWKKGLHHGVVALSLLRAAGFDVSYDIVGEGDEREHLTFLAHDLGLADSVRFHGAQPPERVREVLERADVFLLPSLSEGLSNSALEAMAMEVPTVATSAGGMDEAIENGRDGRIVAPHDPLALAEALTDLLSSGSHRRELGARGAQRARSEFHIGRQVGVFLAEYRRLLSG